MALNILRCAECGLLWSECDCPEHDEEIEQEIEGLKANGYQLDKSDNEEKL